MKIHMRRMVAVGLIACLLTDFSLAAPVPTAREVKLVAKFRHGHREGMHKLLFSPDGKILASVGLSDKTIKLWDVATRKNTAMLEGASDNSIFQVLCFSPDSKTLATASYWGDPSINIWDVASGKKVRAIKGRWGVAALQFSRDGHSLAAAAAGPFGQVQLWDVPSYKERTAVKMNLDSGYRLLYLLFTRESTLLALIGGNKSLIVHEVANTKKRETTLESSSASSYYNSCRFSPDGKNLASAASLYSVRLWDVVSGKNIANYEQQYQVGDLAYSPNCKLLALSKKVIRGREKSFIRLLNARTGRELVTFARDNVYAAILAFSPDGILLAAENEGHIYLWDVRAFRDPGK